MNKLQKIAIAISAVGTGLLASVKAFGAIVSVPDYTDVITASSTAFAQGLVNDLLPWVAAFIAIAVGTLALVAIYRKVVGGFGRLFGGGKRRGRGRRRR